VSTLTQLLIRVDTAGRCDYLCYIMLPRVFSFLIISLVIASIVSPEAGFARFEENWPTYMGNQYLTGNNDQILPEGGGVLWRFRTPGRLYNPVGVNGRVYVVSTDNHLYCLDMSGGSVIWRYRAETPLTRQVVVYRGRVYLPAGRFLYCLEEETGRVIWGRRNPYFGFYGTPAVAAGLILYGNRRGFYARELDNGHLVWENQRIYTYGGGFPSYWNGMVFTVSKEFQQEAARLAALDVEDGSERWSVGLANVPNIFSPVVYREEIFLAFGRQVSVFDAQSGARRAEAVLPERVHSHPVFSQGFLFLSLADGSILRIDPDTLAWETSYRAPYGTQFAAVGGYLLVPFKGAGGGYALVNALTGGEERRVPAPGGGPSSVTASNGIAFLSVGDSLLAIGKGRFLGTVAAGVETGGGGSTGGAAAEPEGATGEPSGTGGEQIPDRAGEETAVIRGTVRDRDTGEPLGGTVEATTTGEDGEVAHRERPFRDGEFEIEVPRGGRTDLSVSSPGYTFESISLLGEEAVDDLSLQPLEVALARAGGGEAFDIESIHYRTGSADLEPGSIPVLRNLASLMRENPGIGIEIAGHTDSTGSEELNQRLSELRAGAVASWLIKQGVASKRIRTRGYGESRPVADNSTEEGRRRNRRTEITIREDTNH
jgi:outer membrane protein OmpA-like peptidoglycan-associated protein/outer membrane protein assembly factor BamB